MSRIMFEHVFHVLSSNERIVDTNDIDHWIVLGSAHNETSDTSESVDADVDRLQAVFRSLAIDNISEFRFEGGTTDQESVDVFLGGKSRGSSGVGRSTVKDTAVSGNIGSGNFGQVLTNGGMGVLCLLGGCGETSSDGPDRFVSDDNIFPIFGAEDISISLDLWKDEIVGGSGFAVFQRLSAARKDLDSLVKSVFGLSGDLFVGFTLFTTF
mmetsp:Transcript_18489/g.37858  ORF Transcript_18489/g.37858 Transcript_18489/m.37858 type:complete len:211 (+) Transcript_18489:904-1536(+)